MKSKFIIVLFLVVIFSCNKGKKIEDINVPIISTEPLMEADLDLSELVDTIYFVPLEMTDESILRWVDKLVEWKGNYYILDQRGSNKVFQFDSLGYYIRSFGRIGRGAQEYLKIEDFCIDYEREEIVILADRRKVYTYSPEGRFLREEGLDFMAVKIECNKDFFCFIGEDRNFYNLITTDLGKKVIGKFFADAEVGENTARLKHPLTKYKDGIYYLRYLDSYIYLIEDKTTVKPVYYVDYGNYGIDFSSLKKQTFKEVSQQLKTHRGDISYFIDNDTYLIFYYFDSHRPIINIYDKVKETSINSLARNLKPNYTEEDFYPLMEYTGENGELIMILSAGGLIDNLKISENAKLAAFVEKSNLQEDSNPILCILKNNK